MPFTKTWLGTTGDYELSTNWELISLRSNNFAWTASGSGTNEYYVRTAASGNPGFVATPPTSAGVYINGSAATKASLGSLAAGNWGYGDNDTLGYSTVYVRLSGGGDPDAQDFDHVQFRQIPQATEHVRIPANAGSISSNLDQSAAAVGDFVVESGYAGTIGATTGYLIIDPDAFRFEGTGQAFIDLYSAAISPRVLTTGTAQTGERGLYLRGSALSVVSIHGGSVGLAVRPGEIATATTVRILGTDASVWLGSGVTLTNLHQWEGNSVIRCGAPTTIIYGGTMTLEESAAVSRSVAQLGGYFTWNSSGTIAAYNMYGGTFDMQRSGVARTLTAFNKFRGSLTILRNKEAVTYTAETPQFSYTESVSG